jgi:hypothetical protein
LKILKGNDWLKILHQEEPWQGLIFGNAIVIHSRSIQFATRNIFESREKSASYWTCRER